MKEMMVMPLMALVFASGCATVTRGTNDVLQIVTVPSGAAVQTSNGFSCSSTPCALTMPRRSEFTVTISHPRCTTVQTNVTHRTADNGAGMVAGNVLVGGIIGLGVDAATGASQDLVPNPLQVTMSCR